MVGLPRKGDPACCGRNLGVPKEGGFSDSGTGKTPEKRISKGVPTTEG